MSPSPSVSSMRAAIFSFWKRATQLRSTHFSLRRRKDGADAVRSGNTSAMSFPEFFPNQGGVPIRVDGQILGGISASGAKSEIDEAIAQAGVAALLKEMK